ncbi:unnamed protein product [Linum trigynum]|uniref:Protein-serine/threonine phosphatase n=1 Tax=Linum trigynum TaxID=586398 RepID=A0AAV2D893_9ROSI
MGFAGQRWKRAGKDAFFISSYNGGVLDIADGVSGWAEEDVDPSLFFFSGTDCNAFWSTTIPQFSSGKHMLLPPQSAQLPCKLIVAVLEGNGTRKFANVGGCGLKLIREGSG